MTVIDGIIFGGSDIGRISASARRTPQGWEWWVTTTRWDSELAQLVEEYLDGGLAETHREAAHRLCEATGAMFG